MLKKKLSKLNLYTKHVSSMIYVDKEWTWKYGHIMWTKLWTSLLDQMIRAKYGQKEWTKYPHSKSMDIRMLTPK